MTCNARPAFVRLRPEGPLVFIPLIERNFPNEHREQIAQDLVAIQTAVHRAMLLPPVPPTHRFAALRAQDPEANDVVEMGPTSSFGILRVHALRPVFVPGMGWLDYVPAIGAYQRREQRLAEEARAAREAA